MVLNNASRKYRCLAEIFGLIHHSSNINFLLLDHQFDLVNFTALDLFKEDFLDGVREARLLVKLELTHIKRGHFGRCTILDDWLILSWTGLHLSVLNGCFLLLGGIFYTGNLTKARLCNRLCIDFLFLNLRRGNSLGSCLRLRSWYLGLLGLDGWGRRALIYLHRLLLDFLKWKNKVKNQSNRTQWTGLKETILTYARVVEGWATWVGGACYWPGTV